MLVIENLVYRIGGRVLFDGASVTVPAGRRVGLVGRNGTGKSTLLRLISGELAPDGGSIAVPARTRVGGVAQDMPRGDTTPLDWVLAADRERAELLARAEGGADPGELAEIHARLDDIAAASAPARAASILAGLGFDAAAQAAPLESFSGGWRMRVALAAGLFAAPDLLLLDEPSNHLDLETRVWLEGFLKSYPGTLLLVSHDRALLNAVADSILHLSGGRLSLYRGGYDDFERARAERLASEAREAAAIEARRRELQAFVDRFRAKATKARQAQSRLKAIQRLETVAPAPPDPEVRFDFPDPEPLPSPLVVLDEAAVGYAAGQPVLRRLGLAVGADDRIALVGANGNGKTTLLKLIEGRLAPMAGTVTRSPKVRIAYFEQEQADAFDLEETPYRHMARLMADRRESEVRAHLGRFGFSGTRADTRIGSLSGGEKARLLFAVIARAKPHLLLLDEPTNHLDIDAREALVEALAAWSGAVMLVTHDLSLVELFADRLWLVADGTCRVYDGDIDEYRQSLERRSAVAAPRAAPAEAMRQPRGRAGGGAPRAEVLARRREVREIEGALERLNAERQRLRAELADPATYARGGDALARLQIRLATLDREIDEAESRWLDAQAALEEVAPARG